MAERITIVIPGDDPPQLQGSPQQGRWTMLDNVFLRGKTLGLIGAGHIAAEMARLASAIGMRVQAWTFHPSAERAQRLGVRFVDLPELLRTSDAVSVHVKLTEQT